MDESLEGLLSLSRPLELQPRSTEVSAILGEVAAAIAGRASRQSVDVAVEAEPSLRHVLDRRLIEQVVLTLALGALDAMPGRGRLVLAARRVPDGSLVLTVADAGAALDDAGRAGLFDPSRAPARRAGGLGLAIACRIVEEHGGTVEAAGEGGRGAAFVVVLPAGPLARGADG